MPTRFDGYEIAPHCVKKGTNTSAHAFEHLLIGLVPHSWFLQQSPETAGISVTARAAHSAALLVGGGAGGAGVDDGTADGDAEGDRLGRLVGDDEGVALGTTVGDAVGVPVG